MAKNIISVVWESPDISSKTGLTLGSSNGQISGTPNVQPGEYDVNVKVTTNYGSDEKTVKIIVAVPDDWKPVIDPNQSVTITADEAMTPYTVTGKNVTISA